VLLILTKVRAGELVTTGPYSLVKHPLYTSVALLALSWLGFLFGTWLGALIGIALYVEAHLRRIEAVDPALNAIVIRLDEQALAAADAADRAVASGNQSVVPRCWLSLDVPFGRRSSGWMRPDAAPDLWSLAPR
jgi:hypothetical protein